MKNPFLHIKRMYWLALLKAGYYDLCLELLDKVSSKNSLNNKVILK